jgi:hypothetical protein
MINFDYWRLACDALLSVKHGEAHVKAMREVCNVGNVAAEDNTRLADNGTREVMAVAASRESAGGWLFSARCTADVMRLGLGVLSRSGVGSDDLIRDP